MLITKSDLLSALSEAKRHRLFEAESPIHLTEHLEKKSSLDRFDDQDLESVLKELPEENLQAIQDIFRERETLAFQQDDLLEASRYGALQKMLMIWKCVTRTIKYCKTLGPQNQLN